MRVKPEPVESLPLDADDAGHVRAVAVEIGAGQPGNEALAVDDARAAAGGRLEVVVRIDAAIDHGHADARAVIPGLPGGVGADRLRGDIQAAGYGAVGRDISDQRIQFQRPDFGRRQKQVDGFHVPEAADDLACGKGCRSRIGRNVVELHDHFDVSAAAEQLLQVVREFRTGHGQAARHKTAASRARRRNRRRRPPQTAWSGEGCCWQPVRSKLTEANIFCSLLMARIESGPGIVCLFTAFIKHRECHRGDSH